VPRKTAENTVKHLGGGVGSVVVTTLVFAGIYLRNYWIKEVLFELIANTQVKF